MHKAFRLVIVAVLPLLSACDRLADVFEIPNPARNMADAEAIGSACRQTGRSIEDCYTLNPNAQKAAVFTGWKTMNDYMMEHNLKEVPSVIPRTDAESKPTLPPPPPPQQSH